MPRAILVHGPLLAVLFSQFTAIGCKVYDPLYCDETTPCTDPERPFCDVMGEYPASEGVGRTCIPDPGVDVPADAGTPDFAIALADDQVEVRARGDLTVEIQLARANGFDEEIAVRVEGLPDGAIADPVMVAEDARAASIVLQAGDAEPGAIASARVVATAADLERIAELDLLVLGPAGSLDPTFGLFGFATEPRPITDDVRVLGHLADGSLLVGGRSLLQGGAFVKFSPAGNLDTEFGKKGAIAFDIGTLGAIAQQSNGKLVVGATNETGDLVVGRFGDDGFLDTDFADGGTISVDFQQSVVVDGLAVSPDDEIVVGMTLDSQREEISLMRFTADGVHDRTFAGGRARLDRGTFHDIGGLEVLSDRSVVATGSASDAKGPFVFRMTAQGAFDPDFGESGVTTLDPEIQLTSAIGGGDGHLLVAGHRGPFLGGVPGIWRLNASGEPDTSFASGGELLIDLPGDRTGSIRSLMLTEEGVLAIGSPGITLVRFDPLSGQLDRSFGEAGMTVIDLNPAISALRVVDVGRGRLVVLADEDSVDFVLARFFK